VNYFLRLFLLVTVTALPACQTAAQEVAEPAKVTTRKISTVKQQFQYRTLETPDKIFETPLDIARHYVGAFPYAVIGRPLVDLKIGRESAAAEQLTIIITTTGYPDDSVFGEQWRIRVDPVPAMEQWRVAKAEHRNYCRSEGGAEWSVSPCL